MHGKMIKEHILHEVYMYTPSSYGGHARYSYELLTALNKLGLKNRIYVALVTSINLDPKYQEVNYRIYDILPQLQPREFFHNFLHWGISRIIHYIRREAIFLNFIKKVNGSKSIHFQEYTPWLAPFHFKMLKSQGVNLFYTVHNIYPHKYPSGIRRRIFNYWNRQSWRLCNALFVHSEKLQEELSIFLGENSPPIFVVPHGIWTRHVKSNGMQTPKIERIARKQLLFFGMIRPNKGLHVLLKTMKLLPDYTLIVAGRPTDEKYQGYLKELASQLKSEQVKFIEQFIDEKDMEQLFSQCSIVVLPYTNFAAQSGVLYDAIVFGLPVVVTDVGSIGESVSKWNIGMVVPPNDILALSEAIKRILAQEQYSNKLKAIKKVRENLSWDQSAKQILKVYDHQLNKLNLL